MGQCLPFSHSPGRKCGTGGLGRGEGCHPPEAGRGRAVMVCRDFFFSFVFHIPAHSSQLSRQFLHSIHLVGLHSGSVGRGQRGQRGAQETLPSPGMYVRREPRLPASAWPTLCDLRQRHVPLWCPESSTPSPSSPAPIIESQLRKESEAHSHCACVTHRALSEGLP